MAPPRPPTDTRQLRRGINRSLLGLTLFVLVVIGALLIALTYGTSAAAVGFGCLMAGAGMIGILWLIFTLIGKWTGAD